MEFVVFLKRLEHNYYEFYPIINDISVKNIRELPIHELINCNAGNILIYIEYSVKYYR